MNIHELAEEFRTLGYEIFVYNNNAHLRILRRRDARYQGPRVISWWPNSRRQTAYDENIDFTWTRATFKEVCDALEKDEDVEDENARAVS